MLSADSDRGRAHWCDVAQWEEGCPTVGTEAARTGVMSHSGKRVSDSGERAGGVVSSCIRGVSYDLVVVIGTFWNTVPGLSDRNVPITLTA